MTEVDTLIDLFELDFDPDSLYSRAREALKSQKSQIEFLQNELGKWRGTAVAEGMLNSKNEKDAARYRWLRDDGDAGDHKIVPARLYVKNHVPTLYGVADIDEAIDLAMQNDQNN